MGVKFIGGPADGKEMDIPENFKVVKVPALRNCKPDLWGNMQDVQAYIPHSTYRRDKRNGKEVMVLE